jgi:hypothetical protein
MDTDLVEPSYVVVVNRTQQRREFMGFGRMHVFQPGEERAITRPFAEWVFTRMNGPMLTHTTDGYVHWLGIKSGPDELLGVLPDTCFETTPLEPVEALEGWDTSVVQRDPDKTKVIKVPVLRADFANQGGAIAGIMGAPGRVLKD